MDCLFCKIVQKEIPADIEYEDEDFLVFQDIHPKAPIHVLIVPKKHIESVQTLQQEDTRIAGELLLTAQKVANQHHLVGYKLAINVGREGGQEVDHLHLHLLANTP
jgi:histidine triad (HIT) family protein